MAFAFVEMMESETRMGRETILRHWLMLREIPVHPQRRSTSEIAERVSGQGKEHKVSARTLQRDLDKLSSIFPYTCEVEGRTNYWFFPKEERFLQIPGMQSAAALAMVLARDHAKEMIPPTVLDHLKPYFSAAEDVLREAVPRSLASWRSRVKVIQRGPILQPAKITRAVEAAVYKALLEGLQLLIMYKAKVRSDSNEQLLHPLGLVSRDGVLYLAATAWSYKDPRTYALHRIATAEALDQPADRLPSFDLDSFIEREFRFPKAPGSIKLVMRMHPAVAVHLHERPLHVEQKWRTLEDGWRELTASVADTAELRWWILGFGDQVEVVAPKKLRGHITEHARGMVDRYGKTK